VYKVKPPSEVQAVLDRAKAREIAEYVKARDKRNPHSLTTLLNVCRRFKISQAEVERIFKSVDFIVISSFAYEPPGPDASSGEKWAAAFVPRLWKNAPASSRLITVLDEE
jgi:hypothetical protein